MSIFGLVISMLLIFSYPLSAEQTLKKHEFEPYEREVKSYSTDELTEENVPWWEKIFIIKKGRRLFGH